MRSVLLASVALLLSVARLHAVTPGMQSVITLQGVITYTAPLQPKTISTAANLVEYKATQTALRFSNNDLIAMIIGNGNPSEVKKWKLVGVRGIDSAGVDLDYQFYLVNTNKAITPLAVPSSTLSTVIYGVAETYTERWQGVSDSAVPVSGTGSFKLVAGLNFSLEDDGYTLDAVLAGPATGNYKIAANTFGSERHVTYVPGAIKIVTTGVVTLSDGANDVPCVGEFTLTVAASQPVDLDTFPAPSP